MQLHVAPAGSALAGAGGHLGALLDADHLTAGPDTCTQQWQAEPGAAAQVEHDLSGAQCQPSDGAPAQWLEQGEFEVVQRRAAPVLLQGGAAVRLCGALGVASHGRDCRAAAGRDSTVANPKRLPLRLPSAGAAMSTRAEPRRYHAAPCLALRA